jgi:DNA processing protein
VGGTPDSLKGEQQIMDNSPLTAVENGTDERLARMALTVFSEPGSRTTGTLIASYGASRTAQIALGLDTGDSDDADLITEFREQVTGRTKSTELEQVVRATARFAAQVIIPGDPEWPEGLTDLGVYQPFALWARGNTEILTQPIGRRVALVGARAATGYGEHVAMELAAGLTERVFTIVSGAAYGIDGMAHRATLAAHGDTIAVLAGGVDRFYPAGHDALLQRITEEGVVISELPPGSPPTRWRFIQRNRIIAAMCTATVVVEAGFRSGSLNTAGHAQLLGRTVAGVPGPVTSAASAGCHRLIRDLGAALVTDARDIRNLLASHPEDTGSPQEGALR